MNIQKGTQVVQAGVPTEEQLAAINAQAKAALTAEQVYVFSLRLCDDQVDRDMERFDTEALPDLAKMFLGKTGIVDHKWSSHGQVARIFQTQVVEQKGVSFIKAWAYIRRGGQGSEVIADIEAGIKKEVSVGCAMGQAVCSVCGSEYGTCGHTKGQVYEGTLCHVILRQPVDAYEFSFVAVPAQRAAGVLKAAGGGRPTLKELSEEFGVQAEYQRLHIQAQLGQRYEKELQDGVVRLFLSLDFGLEEPVLRSIVGKVGADDLQKLKAALENRMADYYPTRTQLVSVQRHENVENGYLI